MAIFPITGVDQGNKTFSIAGDWEVYFIKGKGREIEIQLSTGNNGYYTVVTAVHAAGTTTVEVAETILDATVDGNLKWSSLASLGRFQLGMTGLGEAVGRVTLTEITPITEALVAEGSFHDAQDITIMELLNILIRIPEKVYETIIFTEDYGKYPTTGYMGILGKIVLRMDVDSTDFCMLVRETGQSVEINGTPGRAFLQVQQSKRNYDHGKSVYPGDAVMYSCPEDDPVLQVGDIIAHDGLTYEIIVIQHSFFNGNIIYRESGLKKIRDFQAMRQVTGLRASDNYEGKTTLTWDDMGIESLSHYEVWESTIQLTPTIYQKDNARATSMTNITLEDTQTIDGVDVKTNDVVLVQGQTDAKQNGLYVVVSGLGSVTWTRTTDMAAGSSAAGAYTVVTEGTVGRNKAYVCTNNTGSDIVGTNDLTFTQYTGADNIKEITNELDFTRIKLDKPYLVDEYITGQLVVIADTSDDDGDYAVDVYQNDGYGKGEIRIVGLFKGTAPPGIAYNMKNYYRIDKTKSNSLTIKNLTPNVMYYYLVRAVDVYSEKGRFSTEASTAIKIIGTRGVEGLR